MKFCFWNNQEEFTEKLNVDQLSCTNAKDTNYYDYLEEKSYNFSILRIWTGNTSEYNQEIRRLRWDNKIEI